MKKIVGLLLGMAFIFQFTSANYVPTSSDRQYLTIVIQKIDSHIASDATYKTRLKTPLKTVLTRTDLKPNVLWILTELYTHVYGTTTSSNTSSTGTPGSTAIAGCSIFPSDNPWNTDISNYPVHANSNNYINTINARRSKLHPDFGANWDGGPFGIPYVLVGASQAKVPVTAVRYPEESDQGNFPVPLNAPREKGGDKHVIAVDTDNCMLYELYAAEQVGNGWEAGSSAVFNLKSNALRPDGWTSADAAGLPIFPGLVRYDEVAAGEITHALRFTVSKSQKAYIAPATHFASSITSANEAPMGLRLRLKADYDISGYTGQAKVILTALKKYGMIVADNGSDRYISGAPDSRRDDEDLGQLKNVPGSAFEAVETGPLQK